MAAFRTSRVAARPMMCSVTRPVMGACRPPSLVASVQPNLCPASFAASRRHLSAWSFVSRYLPWGSSEDKKADTSPSEEKKADTSPKEAPATAPAAIAKPEEAKAEEPKAEDAKTAAPSAEAPKEAAAPAPAAEAKPEEAKAEEPKAEDSQSEEKKADTSPSEDKAADASLPSSAQVDAVTASWDKAAALGVETVGVLLFKRIFEIAPEALQLFSFKDEPNLYESDALKKHGALVVGTVGKAVAGLKDLEKLAPVLKNLGKAHAGKGIVAAHYDVVGQALIDTLQAGLGDEAFTEEVKEAWLSVYGVVKATMLEGQAE